MKFYVIHCKGYDPEWIWIKKKREAILAAECLSRQYDVSLQLSDGMGNYDAVEFGNVFQLGLFDLSFEEMFERYVFNDGYYDFYAYRMKDVVS